jgi:hypothetical protein
MAFVNGQVDRLAEQGSRVQEQPSGTGSAGSWLIP